MLIRSCAPGSYRTRLSIERALQRMQGPTTLARRRRPLEPYFFLALGWIPPEERLIQITVTVTTRKVPA